MPDAHGYSMGGYAHGPDKYGYSGGRVGVPAHEHAGHGIPFGAMEGSAHEREEHGYPIGGMEPPVHALEGYGYALQGMEPYAHMYEEYGYSMGQSEPSAHVPEEYNYSVGGMAGLAHEREEFGSSKWETEASAYVPESCGHSVGRSEVSAHVRNEYGYSIGGQLTISTHEPRMEDKATQVSPGLERFASSPKPRPVRVPKRRVRFRESPPEAMEVNYATALAAAIEWARRFEKDLTEALRSEPRPTPGQPLGSVRVGGEPEWRERWERLRGGVVTMRSKLSSLKR